MLVVAAFANEPSRLAGRQDVALRVIRRQHGSRLANNGAKHSDGIAIGRAAARRDIDHSVSYFDIGDDVNERCELDHPTTLPIHSGKMLARLDLRAPLLRLIDAPLTVAEQRAA